MSSTKYKLDSLNVLIKLLQVIEFVIGYYRLKVLILQVIEST